MGSLLQDLHFAIRQLRNAPIFALTAVLTLAVGIGINAAMFSVVDQVLLRPMPFPHPDQLVEMAVRTESGGFSATSLLDIQDWQTRSHSFQQIGYYTEQVPTLGGTSNPKIVPQVLSSANLFDLLQVRPMMGRTFLPEDSKSGRTNIVILSATVWQGMYHADPQIIGRSVPINGMPYTVVGVMHSGFSFPVNTGDDAIWTPIPIDEKSLQNRSSSSLGVIARLRPGVDIVTATHEMNSIHQQLLHEYPKDEDTNPIHMELYSDVVTGSARPGIIALDVAVFAVWLIACANVAGLLLARGNGRLREVALRTALGAQRSRLIRQFLTESLLLSLAAGTLGLCLAWFLLHLLKRYLDNAVIFGDQIHIDLKVCAFLLIASCASAILFGLLPALHASHVSPQDGLRQGTAASGTSRQQTRWRDALVVGEIALTLTLLVAAGLMVRTLISLRHIHTGFVTDQVVTGEIYLPNHSALFINDSPQQSSATTLAQTFYTPLLDRLNALPGTQSTGLTTVRPLEGNWDFNMDVELINHPKPQRTEKAHAQARATSADYFKTMGIRLLQGRFFSTTDSPTATPTAIVNRAFVKRFLPNENPIGQQLRYNDKGERQWSTIVGVVDDTPQKTLGQSPLPEINYNLAQLLPQDELYFLNTFFMNVAIRSPLDPGTVTAQLRRVVHDLQPDAALDNVQTLQQVVDSSLGNQNFAARLLGLFSLAGLLIAIAGIYGLLAYSVSQRTRELGIRLALGAQREDVLWFVLRHAIALLAIGIVLGAVVTIASSKLLTSFLVYKLSTLDALISLSVAILLTICGLAASYLPARRASRIDPVVALRTE